MITIFSTPIEHPKVLIIFMRKYNDVNDTAKVVDAVAKGTKFLEMFGYIGKHLCQARASKFFEKNIASLSSDASGR